MRGSQRSPEPEKGITMHPRTKRQLMQIIKPVTRLMAGAGLLLLLAILAILTLIILP